MGPSRVANADADTCTKKENRIVLLESTKDHRRDGITGRRAWTCSGQGCSPGPGAEGCSESYREERSGEKQVPRCFRLVSVSVHAPAVALWVWVHEDVLRLRCSSTGIVETMPLR